MRLKCEFKGRLNVDQRAEKDLQQKHPQFNQTTNAGQNAVFLKIRIKAFLYNKKSPFEKSNGLLLLHKIYSENLSCYKISQA